MPMFDFKCECGAEFEVLIRADDIAICPACRSTLVTKEWTTTATVIGDECDFVQENGLQHPVRVRSWSEYRRLMKENNCESAVRHIGVPGTDRSPHTSNWSAISPETLAGAKAMLERSMGAKSPETLEAELDSAVEAGEVGVTVGLSDGRSVNLRVENVYSGVIDTNLIRGARAK